MRLNELQMKSLIQTITTLNKVTYLDDDLAGILDNEYYYGRSYEKTVSPLVENLYNDTKDLEQVTLQVANIIVAKFKDKWNRIYTTLTTDYNFNEDYNLSTDKLTNTKGNIVVSETGQVKNKINAFNSDEPVDTDSSESVNSRITNGSNANNEVKANTIIKGKSGASAIQDLLRKEIEVRSNINLIEIMYQDIDSVVTLSIY